MKCSTCAIYPIRYSQQARCAQCGKSEVSKPADIKSGVDIQMLVKGMEDIKC